MGAPDPVSTLPDFLVLFDGVCNLCNGAVLFIIKRDKAGKIMFASLQSELGRDQLIRNGLDPDALHSIIVIENGKLFQKSDAVLHTVARMDGAWPWFRIFRIIPRFLRDALYDLVARFRYKIFGKKDACMIPTPELKKRFVAW
jgi:predicted DCC family thiol-disulfide oxidoreductase YuxK